MSEFAPEYLNAADVWMGIAAEYMAEIQRLTADNTRLTDYYDGLLARFQVGEMQNAALKTDTDTLRAAIQTHHDTRHGTPPRSAAVLAPPDRALYTAAGVAHAVLGFAEGLDERRRAPAPELFTHQPTGMTGYTFRIAWSTDDGEWVGTCDQLPSLSYLHHDPVEAAEWICSLVADYVDELDAKLIPVTDTPAILPGGTADGADASAAASDRPSAPPPPTAS